MSTLQKRVSKQGRSPVKQTKLSTQTTCIARMANKQKCKNRKHPSQPCCIKHWRMIPQDIQDEVWAGYHEEEGGKKHSAAIQKCMRIWREKG